MGRRFDFAEHDIPHPIGDPDDDEELPGDDEEDEDEDDDDDEEPLQAVPGLHPRRPGVKASFTAPQHFR